MAASREFHWVWVDRDRTPDIPQRLSVSAYPSLLVLGPEEENIWRFQSFKPPAELTAELHEGLRRWRLFRAGDDAWAAPPTKTAVLTDAGRWSTLPAPSEAVPSGLVRIGEDLWVAQGRELFAIDPADGAVRRRLPLPVVAQDIASDGALLYVIDAGWDAGRPILAVDPADGTVRREITTAANAGGKSQTSRGLCWHDGSLWVLGIHGLVHRLDPRTGEVTARYASGLRWVFGLAFDGACFVTAGRTGMHLLDAETLQPRREVATNYRLRAVGVDAGCYLLMAQPDFGFDRAQRPVRTWPERMLIYRLQLDR